jgi:hypothetical protein
MRLKPYLLLYIAVLAIITLYSMSCGNSNPAETETTTPTSQTTPIEQLATISLDSAAILALKPLAASTDQKQTQAASNDCNELGKMNGSHFQSIQTTGVKNLCFRGVGFYAHNKIYGSYASGGSERWFITDSNGKVHHLPEKPKTRRGFKNDKLIKEYKGKPAYVTNNGHIVTFDLSTDTEEIVFEAFDNKPVREFVVLPKSDGDHLIFDTNEGVKRQKPDGSREDMTELNYASQPSYFKNGGSLYYVSPWGGKYFVLDGEGLIIDGAAEGAPVEFDTWLRTTDTPKPKAPNIDTDDCQRLTLPGKSIMICNSCPTCLNPQTYNKIYRVPAIDKDIETVDLWAEYNGYNDNYTQACGGEVLFFLGGDKLTVFDDIGKTSQVATDQYQINKLWCVSDSEVFFEGRDISDDSIKTVKVIDANTDAPAFIVLADELEIITK